MTANATSDTILQGWRRRARRLCTGVLGGWLALSPAVAQAAGDRLVIWAWERPEDLRFAHGAEVAVQTGFIDLVGEHMVARGRRFALKTDPGAVTTSVVHVQIEHRIALVWSSARRVQLARKVVELARPGQYRRVQIDFEVRASERQILLDLLHDVRAMLPKETILSMTALASWCDHETWLEGAPVDEVVAAMRRILMARHGQEDFTITTQQQMLDVLGNVLRILTFAVGALGGISLVVGGVGISAIMTIAVSERTSEIGLLRALGAERGEVVRLFLLDAIVLAASGGLAGLVVGAGGAQLLHLIFPILPVHTPWTFVAAAELLAITIGLAAGALPARRAAGITPVAALQAE